MSRVVLAAIHNGELTQAPAAVVMGELALANPTWICTEISEQPQMKIPPNRQELRAWARMQWRLEQQWRNYLTGKSQRPLLSRAGELWWTLRIALNPRFARRAWRSRQIESFVTAKHIQAWRSFLANPGVDELLVLESDAVWRKDSQPRIGHIVEFLGESTEPMYVNVAGGLPLRSIGIEHVVTPESQAGGIQRMTRAVTNTSCAYLINRALAESLIEHIANFPEHGQLGIDWLFNAMFMDAAEHERQISCWHARPPALDHGSLTGITKSWHPER